tara:strand:+ start:5466 stop:5720 length:255 start_codon:yes stop_codon:yes gene_type:complete
MGNFNMSEQFLTAVQMKQKAKVLEAKANLANYFNNAAGVGEHPNLVENVEKLITEIADANGKLEAITEIVNEINAQANESSTNR